MQSVKKKEKGRPYLLLITAIIWGSGFIAQSSGSENVPTMTFGFIRNLIGAAVLIPVIFLFKKLNGDDGALEKTPEYRKNLIFGGIACGSVLFVAASLQQFAFELGSSAGNAGFITACYILIVPILGIFFKKKCGWNVWVSVVIALIGLYFLCIEGEFKLAPADIVLFGCAFAFSVHIIVIDHFTPLVNGVALSALQFFVCGILSGIFAVFMDYHFKITDFSVIMNQVFTSGAWFSILYAGAVSSGVGYTLQVVGQKNVNPTVASLLMSLESVFAVLLGWIILHERMSVRELLGCLLVFAAVVFSQIIRTDN